MKKIVMPPQAEDGQLFATPYLPYVSPAIEIIAVEVEECLMVSSVGTGEVTLPGFEDGGDAF